MRIIYSVTEMQNILHSIKSNPENTIGFVPTMGALHEGHLTLLRRSRNENKFTVLSIFVNPTQFNNSNDFMKYPKTWENDLHMAQDIGVDFVFSPSYEDIYPDSYRFKILESDFSKVLCGAHRPGHFEGMLTIVMKLFNIVRPTRSYFGEKDFQQLQLVKEMVDAFFLETEIVPVKTVREPDGLAMSSRNIRLSPDDRKRAPQIFQILNQAPNRDTAFDLLKEHGFDIEYLEEHRERRFVAVRMGQEPNIIRLIDNVKI